MTDWLPSPVSALKAALQDLGKVLGVSIDLDTPTSVTDKLGVTLGWLGAGFDGIAYSMDQEGGAVSYVAQQYGAIGDDLANTADAIQRSISWVTFTVLPNSLGYLEHEIYAGWIQPLTARVGHDELEISQLWGWVSQLWAEVFNSLRPDVNALQQFEQAFKQGDQPSINTLIAWLRNPATFANWAVPAIALPLANYINTTPELPLHEGWAYVMVNVWENESQAIFDAVTRWAVSDS